MWTQVFATQDYTKDFKLRLWCEGWKMFLQKLGPYCDIGRMDSGHRQDFLSL